MPPTPATSRWVVLTAISAALACSPRATGDVAPARRSRYEPTRFGAECDSVIRRALMTADSANVNPPVPKFTVLPFSFAPDLRGRTVLARFWINEAGMPDPTRIVIRGPIRSPELERLAAALAQWNFVPALLEGCGVPSQLDVSITL